MKKNDYSASKKQFKYASGDWLTMVRRRRRRGGTYDFTQNDIYIRLLRSAELYLKVERNSTVNLKNTNINSD